MYACVSVCVLPLKQFKSLDMCGLRGVLAAAVEQVRVYVCECVCVCACVCMSM